MKGRIYNRFFRLQRYDFKQGTRQNISRYLVGCGVLVFICQIAVGESRDIGGQSSYLRGLVYIFDGIPEYIKTNNSEFTIPVIWLLFHSYLLFLVGSYPCNDLDGYGKNILLFSKNRNQWWICKCIWTIGSVILFYGLCSIILCISLYFQESNVLIAVENSTLSSILSDKNQLRLLIYSAAILPCLTSVAFSLIQMFLSFLVRPAVGYIIVLSILVISVYMKHPLLIGNYSMMSRNALFVEGGFTLYQGIIVNGVVIMITLAAGNWYIRRRDIIHGGE